MSIRRPAPKIRSPMDWSLADVPDMFVELSLAIWDGHLNTAGRGGGMTTGQEAPISPIDGVDTGGRFPIYATASGAFACSSLPGWSLRSTGKGSAAPVFAPVSGRLLRYAVRRGRPRGAFASCSRRRGAHSKLCLRDGEGQQRPQSGSGQRTMEIRAGMVRSLANTGQNSGRRPTKRLSYVHGHDESGRRSTG